MARKPFFKEPTAKHIIKNETKKADSSLVEKILELERDQALQITRRIIPDKYYPLDGFGNLVDDPVYASRKFMRHGPEVKIKTPRSITTAVSERVIPCNARAYAYDHAKNLFYSSYSYYPVFGKDKRKRKVPLTSCFEGARIYAYAHQVLNASIAVRPYHKAKRVKKEGASVVCLVPSREKGESRHEMRFNHIPVVDVPEKFAIGYNINSDHVCSMKRYDIRYKYETYAESSDVRSFCPHEAAGLIGIIDHYYIEECHNIIPLEMSTIALPSKEGAEFYKQLRSQVVIGYTNKKGKRDIRKLNLAEMNLLLNAFTLAKGHNNVLYSEVHRDGSLRNYDWSFRKP